MLFPTVEFTIFFLLTLSGWYFFNTQKQKVFSLVVFNSAFYAFYSVEMLIYLMVWVGILYVAGKRRSLINLGIGFAILQLLFWKSIEAGIINYQEFKTPLGLSFFTFQGLTYIFALLKLPQKNTEQHLTQSWGFWKLFAFTGFFPTVFSGPIMRAKKWDEQLKNPIFLSPSLFNLGLTYIALGAFYKLCLSSIFHDYTALAFSNPQDETGETLFIGSLAYTFEIYHDFAGYSLMSIGIALFYGFQLPENFKQPYFSLNIRDFWQRWHISFSMWLRDYLYFSLGGSKNGNISHIRNTLIVMIICGAWHGLSSNYLLWGTLQGLAILGYHFGHKYIHIPNLLAWLITFVFINISWIIFKSPTATDSFIYLQKIFDFTNWNEGFSASNYWVLVLCLISLLFQKMEPIILQKRESTPILLSKPAPLTWGLIFITILIISPSGMPPFIYFSY